MTLNNGRPIRGSPPQKKYTILKRKSDALELAKLIYDIYKDNQNNSKVNNGQNNAQKIKKK